jgi:hypothetical protein
VEWGGFDWNEAGAKGAVDEEGNALKAIHEIRLRVV